MRLIDADELYKELEGVRMDYIDEDSMTSKFAADVIETVQDEYLAKSPTVDAVPVRNGYWRGLVHSGFYGFKEDGSEKYREQVTYHCSNCGRRTVIKEKYCPSCGARMDLEV